MKIAFIENRYKTLFWDAIVKELRSMGHSTAWLVQNPIFSPSDGLVYVIPFPKRKEFDLVTVQINRFEQIISGDRFINYFGGNSRHYRYYQSAIKKWLDHVKPDIVIGECTLFHELLVIDECQSRGIPYLHPSMPGYPGNRFSIYTYASKEPAGENSELPSDAECLAVAEAIGKGEKIPDYMIPPSGFESERAYPMPRSLRDRFTILRGYLQGERFNTPAPLRKWLLDRKVKRNLAIWKKIVATKTVPEKHRFLLYPMQMQPEANLDVWGQKFRNQAKLVHEIADCLPEQWHLLVKANPKSKYEMNKELIEILQEHRKVSPISLSEPMSSVLQRVDLVCTVTGTVAIECVLSGKPVVQLGPGVVDNGAGCAQIGEITKIPDVIRQIEEGSFTIASEAERIKLVQKLYRSTFPGKVSDPVYMPMVMARENVQMVAHALAEVAKQCV